MSLDIHMLIAALKSTDVWDAREIDSRPAAETIATLREYAWCLTLNSARDKTHESVRPCAEAPLACRT